MGESEDKTPSPGVPAWQRAQANDSETPKDDTIEVARRFLDDDEIKVAPRDKKVAFLKSKGVQDGDVQKLLGDPEETRESSEQHHSTAEAAQPQPPQNQGPPPSQSAAADRPPIVTYPEFLAKPARPPPLVTTNGLLTTLYAFAGLSTALYGTSRYLLGPMVDSLTDARLDLHAAASHRLDGLLTQLEGSVSEIPPAHRAKPDAGAADDASDADDPSEMFHRDVGTQTTALSDPSAASSPDVPPPQPESLRQADRLSALTSLLGGLKDDIRSQSGDLEDVKTLVDVFRDDLDALTYAAQSDLVGAGVYGGAARKPEPDDAIRKVRDNIRKVKGVLLSTRNFPTSTR